MKFSEQWLRTWVNPPIDSQSLEACLTMAGFEVEGHAKVAPSFSGVEVAYVQSTSLHPEADRLTVCDVQTGEGVLLTIVCGAANVRPGLKVALARIGALLPNGMKITKAKLRGVESFGMLCGASELGLEGMNEGILELLADAPLGMSLYDYFLLNDEVFEVDITPNRGDCLSIQGLAREVSAFTKTPMVIPVITNVMEESDDVTYPLCVLAHDAAPRYAFTILKDFEVKTPLPIVMRERLRRAGLCLIHPVVDLLNLVMLELGQPMHVFDLELIQGQVVVRYAKTGETLIVLGGTTLTLTSEDLVIADDRGPIALAGVIGGEATKTTEMTRHFLIESPFFNPSTIGATARRYGLLTESAQRFSRGVDPNLSEFALARLKQLLGEIGVGCVSKTHVLEAKSNLPLRTALFFHPARVLALTGVEIPYAVIETCLVHLGFLVATTDERWEVIPPSYRFDIAIEADLVEEVLRLYGYDNIQSNPMQGFFRKPVTHPIETVATTCREFLVAKGFHETIHYSFVDPKLAEAYAPDGSWLTLVNPISSTLSVMRQSLWPGLLASLLYNVNRQQETVRMFEIGVGFQKKKDNISETSLCAGLLMGDVQALNWASSKRLYDFFDLKGVVTSLLECQGAVTTFLPAEHPFLHPHQSACIEINGVAAGLIGVLHPSLGELLGFEQPVILFEFELAAAFPGHSPRYQAISKYPKIRRDLSLVVPESVLCHNVVSAILAMGLSTLQTVHVFDVYEGESLPLGHKSMAFALFFQALDRTLVETEIQEMISAILKTLEKQFAITLRELS